MSKVIKAEALRAEALDYHRRGGIPGKLCVNATKPLITQGDLSLAYSPGVAHPCLEISRDPAEAYSYTAKGNFVAVISNGTAVLGLGNLGALAAKPVMEGKAVLFKRFAGIDSIDIEVNTENVEDFIKVVELIGCNWGGINLEDIRAPECFVIEQTLRTRLDIPVFHDDQHGTAIIVAAGMINAAEVTGRKLSDIKLAVSGCGAAGVACMNLLKSLGLHDMIVCDQNGVLFKGRKLGMNETKDQFVTDTPKRTLAEAIEGADAFLGLSVKDVLSADMLRSMAPNPIIFAMANPDPEIDPELAKEVRPDAIVATGRSDYPNQVNNVMCFPYIFRGALDVRAKTINEEMKLAASYALAELAKEPVTEEVTSAYAGRKMQYGVDYIIPTPFDPRLIVAVPMAVAKAAMETGVANKPIEDWDLYARQLRSLLSPFSGVIAMFGGLLKNSKRTVIFSEGEEERSIRCAVQWRDSGYGKPILVGREDQILRMTKSMGLVDLEGIEITNAAKSLRNDEYIDLMYGLLNRKGYLYRTCVRQVKTDRNVFASCMLASGEADLLLTGLTRGYYSALQDVQLIIGKEDVIFGLSIVVAKGRTIFIADTAINDNPSPEMIAKIAIKVADIVKRFGDVPRVAMVSFSNFGSMVHDSKMGEVLGILDKASVGFEYDGEMTVDVALDDAGIANYPFCKLTKSANILLMPSLDAAAISSSLAKCLGDNSVIGPILVGMKKPVQIVKMTSSVSEIMAMAVFAAWNGTALATSAKKKEAQRR